LITAPLFIDMDLADIKTKKNIDVTLKLSIDIFYLIFIIGIIF